MGMTGISSCQVSSVCRGIGERVQAFLQRPLGGEWPSLWLDATYVKVRKNGRVVSVTVIIACAVSSDRRREIIGRVSASGGQSALAGLPAEPEGALPGGIKLFISDAHNGLKAAIQQMFCASWQHCRSHFMRNLLSRVSRTNQSVVRAALQQGFVETDEKSAHATWREVAGQLEKSTQSVTKMMDEVKAGVPTVSIFPDRGDAHRRLDAALTEQNEEGYCRTGTVRSTAWQRQVRPLKTR